MKIISALLLAALLATPHAAAPKKILVVTTTTGFRHSSIATSEKIIAQLAKNSGAFTVEFVQQPSGNQKDPAWQESLKTALQNLEQANGELSGVRSRLSALTNQQAALQAQQKQQSGGRGSTSGIRTR